MNRRERRRQEALDRKVRKVRDGMTGSLLSTWIVRFDQVLDLYDKAIAGNRGAAQVYAIIDQFLKTPRNEKLICVACPATIVHAAGFFVLLKSHDPDGAILAPVCDACYHRSDAELSDAGLESLGATEVRIIPPAHISEQGGNA